MSRMGFIHDKLDIKFLVLYLMARGGFAGGLRHPGGPNLLR